MVNLHSGILYSSKNEWPTVVCKNMDESHKHNMSQRSHSPKGASCMLAIM